MVIRVKFHKLMLLVFGISALSLLGFLMTVEYVRGLGGQTQSLSAENFAPPIIPASSTPLASPLFQNEAEAASDSSITLIAVGDVMLGRSVNTRMLKYQDWQFPFLETAEVLRQADLTFGNLESPFGFECPPIDEGFIFCADQRSVVGLTYAGFDVLSLANNHALNQGQDGLELSKEILQENGIANASFGESTVVEVKGLKIGFVMFDDTSNGVAVEDVQAKVKQLAQEADVVAASFHWGVEYVAQPNAGQEELARAAIDAGASLVLGHHPHWVQTIEEYNGGLIYYSLGNFVFDQMWSEETKTGMVAEIELTSEGVVSHSERTVKIFEYAQPRWQPEPQAKFLSE